MIRPAFAPGPPQQCLQVSIAECLAYCQTAVPQAQVQQARTALGIRDFQGVLQDQHLDGGVDWRNPAADAGALRAQAALATSAANRRRFTHGLRLPAMSLRGL